MATTAPPTVDVTAEVDMAAAEGGTKRTLEVAGETLEITVLGAGSEVGRSCCIMTIRDKTVMFDCGIHPAHTGMSTLPYFDNIDPSEVDLCLVTHFHLDHSGAVPYFVNRTSFEGRVFMTPPTRPICRFLWEDYARVSKTAEEAIFSRKDIDATMTRIELIDFHQEFEHNGIKFSCFGAGHVLGAAMFMVEVAGVRVLYTGDYSREVDRHLPQAEIPTKDVHVLIVESTYGIQNHEPREQREARFTNLVHQIVRQGGKCLLPVFALGRAQELLLILEDYWRRNPELQPIPIYYVSPMTSKCMRIFETYTTLCSDGVQEEANRCKNPWLFEYVRNLQDSSPLFTKEMANKPCVVMAAPGMLQSGCSRQCFEAWAGDRRNGIIMTGYSVAGTLAYDLRSEPDKVTIAEGKQMKVECTVKFLSFSAHSDYSQTREFIEALKTPNVVLVHGEATEMGRLAKKLRDDFENLNVVTPKNCEQVDFIFHGDYTAQAVGSLALQDDKGAAKVEASSPKRKKPASNKLLDAVLLEQPDGSRFLMKPNEAADFCQVPVMSMQQSQSLPVGQLSIHMIKQAVAEVYEDMVEIEEGFKVCNAVTARLQNRVLTLEWSASPMTDMVADSITFIALDLLRSPAPPSPRDHEESTLFDVVCCSLQQNYGALEKDKENMRVGFSGPGKVEVIVDFPKRAIECEDEAVKAKVRANLKMCEDALFAVPPS